MDGTPEAIEPGGFYSTTELRGRLGLGPIGWQSLVRSGLRTVKIGKRTYVFADDFLAAVRRQQDQEATPCG